MEQKFFCSIASTIKKVNEEDNIYSIKKILLVLLILSNFLFGENIAVEKELKNILYPKQMIIYKDRAYITDCGKIKIFDIKDFKLIVEFGREGEGPGEFRRGKEKLFISVLDDKIMAHSYWRISWFSLLGKFEKSIELRHQGFGETFYPLGDRFVSSKVYAKSPGNHIKQGFTYVISIYSPDLKSSKVLYEIPYWSQGWVTRPYHDAKAFTTNGERLYIADNKGFPISVYDKNAKLIDKINFSMGKVPFTKEDKKQFFRLKSEQFINISEKAFQEYKNTTEFPKYFPDIMDVKVWDNLIFVKTSFRKKNNYKYLVFDMRGNYKQALFMRDEKFFEIYKGKRYVLYENDDETWSIKIKKILRCSESNKE